MNCQKLAITPSRGLKEGNMKGDVAALINV